ncbi:MAG: glycerophosphodiester phosphodiesterase family protein [Patescibacteria group bacterium]
MIEVIAHRGNFLPEGPIPEVQNKYIVAENTLEAFERAFNNGWGVETDVRIWEDGNFVLIHDADAARISKYHKFKIPTLDELCQLAKGAFIAFQIKRSSDPKSGVEVGRAVAKMMQQYNLQESILFDATLEEAQILSQEFPWLNLSISVGEKNYTPTIYTPYQALTTQFTSVYTSVWTDEWKIPGSIYNELLFKKLRAAYPGRIDVISPELHYNEDHPFSKDLEKLKKLWREIVSWDLADGICTDYPTQLNTIL